MPIQTTEKIWHNGELIPWEQATIHVMSHVIHYGSSVFEGIRCYGQPHGSAVFRLPEHMQRLLDSAKIYRMEVPYTLEELCAGVVDVIEANGVAPCYIRPIILRGYGEIGVSPKGSPIEVYIANFPWGKYISGHGGAVLRQGGDGHSHHGHGGGCSQPGGSSGPWNLCRSRHYPESQRSRIGSAAAGTGPLRRQIDSHGGGH